MSFFGFVLSLFVVFNALGNLPLFIGLLARYDAKTQRRIILRELCIALFILLLFNFFGDAILKILGISEPIIGIAGGVVLFLIALGMIFPKSHPPEVPAQEPFIVPLATPIIAGPGAIAYVMLFAAETQNYWISTLAIILAWVPALCILLLASNIKYILGEKGLVACERMGGMIISLIAVQMFSTGCIKLIKVCFFP